jgi:hypothetical protein
VLGQNEKREQELLAKLPPLSVFWLHKNISHLGTSLCDMTDLETEEASTLFSAVP